MMYLAAGNQEERRKIMEKRNENRILWLEFIIYVLSRIVVVVTVCYLILHLAEK